MIFSDRSKRCILLGEYLVETQSTVRNAAKHFGISKSTVHKDVTEVLKYENIGLFCDVQKVLIKNKNERHLRGGEATKQKYAKIAKNVPSDETT